MATALIRGFRSDNLRRYRRLAGILIAFLLTLSNIVAQGRPVAEAEPGTSVKTTDGALAILWREPASISARDLYYGEGGKDHAPRTTIFTFLKEDLSGSNPKFVVTDKDGVHWKIKVGAEAKPEVAAQRLVWAAGYFTDEDYYLPELRITGLPAKLHRGRRLFGPEGTLCGARLQRMDKKESNDGNWKWKHSVFAGTRELNGLRVLMAFINNWDLKDNNNKIRVGKEDGIALQTYYVSDLGASFGTAGIVKGHSNSRGNLEAFESSKFITKITDRYISFAAPSRPTLLELVNPPQFFMRLRLRWIGRHIPRSDAKWMAAVLARLSPQQIRDAFRAAGYSSREVEDFAEVLENRIAALNDI